MKKQDMPTLGQENKTYVPYGEPSPSQEGNSPPDKINVYEENMPKETLSGVDLIAKERQEQIEKHGRTIQGDIDNNDNGQLAIAAIALLKQPKDVVQLGDFPAGWDYGICFKMANKTEQERLVIAGALIAAEIDRLQAANNK